MNKTAEAATAYHEAGHAIIAFRRGLFLKVATIEPNKDQDYLGRVVGNFAVGIGHEIEYADTPPRVQRRIENYAVMSLAGEAAQRRFNPRNIRSYHGLADRQSAFNLLSYLCEPTSEVMKHYFTLMKAQACAAVQDPINWRAIELLAEELIVRRTIKGKELREFIGLVCLALPEKDKQ